MLRKFIHTLKNRIRTNRQSFIVYSILRFIVIGVLIRSIFTQNFESAGICILSLVLFLLPAFFEQQMKIEIPPVFESIIYLFIFAAEILGEINHYYILIPGWDTMLHTINGFLAAAVGFSLVDVFNQRSERNHLSPIYLTLVAFCFSMTIGVLWEFFEFAGDYFLQMDMQKDFVIQQFGTVSLDPNGKAIILRDIVKTTIELKDGSQYIIHGGYLDIGIIDTMKDLFVNFIGAIVFSFIGFCHIYNRESFKITNQLLISKAEENEASDD